ncbi:MAG: isoprenylcysteine carboxylmethyltransferase family protein [Micrococcaceae bacterium]|jgi:protein-S-isoprenylcysteine O-methyltransferase Ste14|nr:isoprenylcysteine carboxylmethyltransferase family protein [Micrococcaceae bacterium]
MTPDTASALALGLYTAGVVVTFGVRSWLHRRRTGSTGFHGFSGTTGSAGWWGGVLFIVALLLGAVGPLLALAGIVVPPPLPGLAWVGLIITVLGFLGVLAAQTGMGASWRIGVDATERTELVTTGMFAVVRNPIFTAMLAALTGLVLMVPTPVTGAALVCLFLAVELQVRVVEEPYLISTHRESYASYAAEVGRFLPRVGRARVTTTT